MSYGALESKLEYPHIMASKLSFLSFLASIIFSISHMIGGSSIPSVLSGRSLGMIRLTCVSSSPRHRPFLS